MSIPSISGLPAYPSRTNRASALYRLWDQYQQLHDRSDAASLPAAKQPPPPPPSSRLIANPTGGSVAYLLRRQVAPINVDRTGTASVQVLSRDTIHQAAGNNARQIPRLLVSRTRGNPEKRVSINVARELEFAKAATAGLTAAHAKERIRALGWVARRMHSPENTPGHLM